MTRKGLHGEAEYTFTMRSDEQEVSGEDVAMSRKCSYGGGRHWR